MSGAAALGADLAGDGVLELEDGGHLRGGLRQAEMVSQGRDVAAPGFPNLQTSSEKSAEKETATIRGE